MLNFFRLSTIFKKNFPSIWKTLAHQNQIPKTELVYQNKIYVLHLSIIKVLNFLK
jgi:hypothetical protein